MADPNEPRKETVRIALPPQPPAVPGVSKESRETVRINLPPRPPSTPSVSPGSTEPGPLPPKAPLSPPPAPVPPRPVASPAAPVNIPEAAKSPPSPPSTSSQSPMKETARIPLPDAPVKPTPTVQMKKTQPLITMPETVPQSASLTMARVAPSEPVRMADAIPKPLCWGVFIVSFAILIIQIWNYLL